MKNENIGNLFDWGQSMYGGWYVQTWAADGSRHLVGHHFGKLQELRAWAKDHGVILSADRRMDN